MAQDANVDQDAKPVARTSIERFAESSWIQVMVVQGIQPRHYHPTADLMEDAELPRFLETIRGHVERTVGGLSSHEAYLRQYCPAVPPA